MRRTKACFIYKLCLLLLLVTGVLLVVSSCAPAGQPSNPVSSSEHEESLILDEALESPTIEEPPYGKPKAPSNEIVKKLSQTFPVGNTYGWLTIPNTTIDNAVMFSPDSNEVYLEQRIDYEGNNSKAGLIFADYRDNLGNRDELCPNTVIYGHNIEIWGGNNGKRFSQLLQYANLDFAKKNQFISFSTLTDEMVWQVFAAFYTDTNLDYIDTNPSNEKLMFMISEAGQRTENFFDVEVTPQDKFLTLSTCAYDFGVVTKRFVVMAKLLDSNASLQPAEVTKNESPKLPSFG